MGECQSGWSASSKVIWLNLKSIYTFRHEIVQPKPEPTPTSTLSGYLTEKERRKANKHAAEDGITVDQYLIHKYGKRAAKRGWESYKIDHNFSNSSKFPI